MSEKKAKNSYHLKNDMAEPELYRHERKFLLERQHLYQVNDLIKLHPARFGKVYQTRYVNNIYFDTPHFKHFSDSISGVSQRRKVRIRWYGDLFQNVQKPRLEFKEKQGHVCMKKISMLDGFQFKKGIGEREISLLLNNAKLPEERKIVIRQLRPVLVNRYRREYWITRDKKYRLTVDSKMSFWGWKRFRNYFLASSKDRYNLILELKYPLADDISFPKISRHFPFRQSRSSKYVTGIEHIYRATI